MIAVLQSVHIAPHHPPSHTHTHNVQSRVIWSLIRMSSEKMSCLIDLVLSRVSLQVHLVQMNIIHEQLQDLHATKAVVDVS